jgi:cytochrome c peroxidase
LFPPIIAPTQPPLTASQLRFAALNMNFTSLAAVDPPEPANLGDYVVDRTKLLQLGKALFWEQQLGSDGQACASCHFHAGADSRSKNQLNPGFRNTVPPGGDNTFGNTPLRPLFRTWFGPDRQLVRADFPLHLLADPANGRSLLLRDTNDVVSSQGSFSATFSGIGVPFDAGVPSSVSAGLGAIFHAGRALVRSVAPRNSPSVVNAVFNHRNFWDARARAEFNGQDPIGALDPTGVVVEAPAGGTPTLHAVRILDASTASQADGPPLSDVEMSFSGRRFADLGRKMLSSQLQPLALQRVALDDSVLGPLSRQVLAAGARGLTGSYADLVQAAFDPRWWNGGPWMVDLSSGAPVLTQATTAGPNRFTVAEYNFPLLFGLAIREYESILIADQTPFDAFMEGDNAALGSSALAGLQLFLSKAHCAFCHGGPELTNAGETNVVRRGALEALDGRTPVPDLLERMLMGDGTVAVYDTGNYNIAVRPTSEDLGLGATIGPLNLPLSNSRRFQACVKQAVAGGATVRDANDWCGVSRILARPFEAERVLRMAAKLLGDPADVLALLATADGILGPNDPLVFSSPDLFGGSMPLFQARDLLQTKPGAQRPGVQRLLRSATLLLPDLVDPGFDVTNPFAPPLQPDERAAVDGAFKVPGLRNVALTAPYFHNGGQLTLAQVVEFYNRGADFPDRNVLDRDPDIEPLALTATERANVVAFLEALTDERVRWERAPFDHPSLSVPNGGTPGVPAMVYFLGVGVLDNRFELPEVGAGGSPKPLGTARTPLAAFPDPQR